MEQDFESIAPSGWKAVRYEDRPPKRGERADIYHAKRTYPNRTQFLRKGYTMVDTMGRLYSVADGMDRLEAERAGMVAPGDPALVEPKLVVEGDQRSIVFERSRGVGENSFRSGRGINERGVSKGPQMLYCYLPLEERKENPELSLPAEGEELKIIHLGTEMLVKTTVVTVNGNYLPVHATGSLLVDNLRFFIMKTDK
jgi:hypothetical protein